MNPEQIQEVAERIARSRHFQRSEQLRTMLLALCAEVAKGRESEITEAMIGERILNRKHFDPETDTIVRVQMRRLRNKLDEYYRAEGALDPLRLEIPRHSYIPRLIDAAPASAASEPHSHPEPEVQDRWSFWRGVAAASALFAVLGTAAFLLARRGETQSVAVHPVVAKSPFWRGIIPSKAQSVIAVSTPLFFRTRESYLRDFRLNFQEDLVHTPTQIENQPAWPAWTTFVSLADLQSAVLLERLLSASGSRPVVKSAREVTSAELQQSPIVFLGHPRGSPALFDLLADLPFYVRRTKVAEPVRGIVNRSPRHEEPPEYLSVGENDLEILTESRPDYVLVTSLPRPAGAGVLSVFGNRYASTYPVLQRLLDPSFLRKLQACMARESGTGWGSEGVQVVFRVLYLNGNPMEVEYLTHRPLSATVNRAGIQ